MDSKSPKNLRAIKRCWARLLIHKRYRLLKEFLDKNPPMSKRKRQKRLWEKELAEIVENYTGALHTRPMVTFLKNGLGCWYTCLSYPGMEPTNNPGE